MEPQGPLQGPQGPLQGGPEGPQELDPPSYKAPLIGSAVGLAFGLAFGALLDIDDRVHALETKR